MSTPSRYPTLLLRAAHWLLVLALLWAQNLGLWHRIAHGATPTGVAVVERDGGDVARDSADSGAPTTWLLRLFVSHQDGRDCLGFDDATLGAALVAAALVLAGLFGAAHLQGCLARGASAGTWRPFQARAPPAFH